MIRILSCLSQFMSSPYLSPRASYCFHCFFINKNYNDDDDDARALLLRRFSYKTSDRSWDLGFNANLGWYTSIHFCFSYFLGLSSRSRCVGDENLSRGKGGHSVSALLKCEGGGVSGSYAALGGRSSRFMYVYFFS